MTTRVLLLGAGAAAQVAAPKALQAIAAARQQRLDVHVFDQAVLTAAHLAHADLYPQGRPGTSKAEALAERLRAAGHRADALCGNISRWPATALRADLAIVALDDEAARSTAGRMLRQAGTPAVFVGIADSVSMHVIGRDVDAPCYDCQNQERVPVGNTSCVPDTARVSTRLLCTPAARQLLLDHLPGVCVEALAGQGMATFRSWTPGQQPLLAAMTRSPGCFGQHDPWPDASTQPTRVLAADTRLATVLAEVGPQAQLQGITVRSDYFCPACGRTDLRGGELQRRWPARERCPCGSADIQPLLQLDMIDHAEATRLDLLAQTLGDLGVVPGAEFVAARPDGTCTVFCRAVDALTDDSATLRGRAS